MGIPRIGIGIRSIGIHRGVLDSISPSFSSGEVGDTGSTTLVIVYSENLNEGSVPATTDYAVTARGANVVTNVDVSGDTVTLTLTDVVISVIRCC